MIDTHTHLYLDDFKPSPVEVVDRAIESGVNKMVMPNIDVSTIEPLNLLCAQRPANLFPAMGLHPTEVDDNYESNLSIITDEIRNNNGHYIAIGEIGMDLYWDKTFAKEQAIVFERQCKLAVELRLPVIIHCREALDEILEVLKSLDKIPDGVMHSFSGSIDDVNRVREIAPEFYFGINGIVTFKNSKLSDVLSAIPIDRLLLETDSPYLAPVPCRGRRNESAFVNHTANFIANHLGIDIKELENITDRNASRLFRF